MTIGISFLLLKTNPFLCTQNTSLSFLLNDKSALLPQTFVQKTSLLKAISYLTCVWRWFTLRAGTLLLYCPTSLQRLIYLLLWQIFIRELMHFRLWSLFICIRIYVFLKERKNWSEVIRHNSGFGSCGTRSIADCSAFRIHVIDTFNFKNILCVQGKLKGNFF